MRTTQVVVVGALGSDPESPAADGLDSWGMGLCGCLHGVSLRMGRDAERGRRGSRIRTLRHRAWEERLRDEETENQEKFGNRSAEMRKEGKERFRARETKMRRRGWGRGGGQGP